MENTAVRDQGINRGVLYLEFKYGGFLDDYPVSSQNLSELMNLPHGLAMKRLIDYRHVLMTTNNVTWLYSLFPENYTEKLEDLYTKNPNASQMLADLYVFSFIQPDNDNNLKPTHEAFALLSIPLVGPPPYAKRLAEFRDILWEEAKILHNDILPKIDTNQWGFIDGLQRFWAMVMDYFMVLTICKDIQEYTFVQYVLLVGQNHQNAIRWFFGDPKLGSMTQDGCVDLDGTAMLTINQ